LSKLPITRLLNWNFLRGAKQNADAGAPAEQNALTRALLAG
jgi:hypothetical protein